MTYFHGEDGVAATMFDFYPCRTEKIYVSGLRNGDFILSESPYYFQNQDGRVVGIDTRFSEFKVFDSNQILINKLSIDWNSDCIPETIAEKSGSSNINNHQTDKFLISAEYILLFCIIVVVLRMIAKRMRGHKNENKA